MNILSLIKSINNLMHMRRINNLSLVKNMKKPSLIKGIKNLTHMKSINNLSLVKTMKKPPPIKA